VGIYRAERDAPRFTWSDLGDITEGRPDLGPDCPVLVYRLLELALRDTLTAAEDLDCSGLPVTGDMVCDYDEGFIAGVLSTYSGREFVAREVDCWASGGRICRFAARPLTAELDTA
jgi:hypothetical protein